ncbi:carboxymuconolactone decarboxylase family protein [Nocardiopsis tropica]|uniref:carboxymuconolactone decarboxylase family protein n=1 Tax=Tsukamurella TaxID=2060 RepID=UPI001C7CBA57|nr:carboxymuconolactone decarboxylase family protein [Tsukamurella sp. TY48]GIZ97880.1 alkyl hydroperoxide reductase AhpD [Tsukamurella sp. TY48]
MAAERVRIDKASPETYKKLVGVSTEVGTVAAAAGLSRAVVELVNLRCSQINGCAYCLSLHHDLGIAAGLTEQQIAVLPAWRDAPALFDDQQRAALEIAELVTNLPPHHAADIAYDRATDVLDTDQTAALIWAAIAINAFNRLSIVSGYEVRKKA